MPVNWALSPPPFANCKMSDTSGGLVTVGRLNVPLTSTGIGTSTPIADPVPETTVPRSVNVIVSGGTPGDAESSDHVPAIDGVLGDVLDAEHPANAATAMTQERMRKRCLHTKIVM